jgi:PAS domain S-box-containing protein
MANQPKTNDGALKELADLKLKFESLKIQYERDINECKQTEEKLRLGDQIIQSIIDSSPALIYLLDTDGKFILSNRRLETLLGVSHDKLIGNTRDLYFPKEIADQHRNNDLEVINSKQSITFEEENLESDRKHFYLTDKFPLIDSNGNVYAICGISTDITEHKLAEKKLLESEEKFRTIADNSADAIFIVDRLGRYLFVNSKALNLLGYSKEELLSLTIADIAPKNKIEKHLQTFERILQEGSLFTEIEVVKKDGQILPIDLNAVVLPDGMIYGSCRDITERRQVVAALQESENKYRDLVEQINDVIFSTDANGVFTYISPSIEILGGYKPEEMTGHFMSEFLDPAFLPKIKEQFQKVMSGLLEPMEYRTKIKSGDYRLIRSSSRPILKDDVPIGIRGVFTDITDRKQAEEKLRKSEELFRNVFVEGPLGIAIAGLADGRIISANKALCEMLGYTEEELKLLTFVDVTHPDHSPLDIEVVRKMREGQIQKHYTEKQYLKNPQR